MSDQRVGGLDLLRGAALVAMLIQHLTGWFGSDARDILPGWSGFAVTDVAAPAFTVALGASVPLLIESRRRRGLPDVAVARVTLRRYGLLIPLGVALRWAVGFDLGRLGVLETLGLAALAVGVLTSTVRPWARIGTAIVVLMAAPFVERAAEGRDEWLATHVLTGTFPFVTYLGFALVGAALVPIIRRPGHRGIVGLVAGMLCVAAFGFLLAGDPPDRYPGDVSFIVPGLAGTLLLYLLVTSPRLPSLAARTIERSGAHTLGVFVGHYTVFAVLQATGRLHALTPVPAVALSVAVTLAVVSAAPLVPPLPWSPRTGRRVRAQDVVEPERSGALRAPVTSRCG